MFDFLKRKKRKVEISGVYAGPREIGRPDPAETGAVYAGPQNTEWPKGVMGRVYAGPKPVSPDKAENGNPSDAEIEDVYGGPDMWDGPEEEPVEEEDLKPYPENFAEEEEGNWRVCPACGAKVPENSPFCTECGTPLKDQEDKPDDAAMKMVYAGPDFFLNRQG